MGSLSRRVWLFVGGAALLAFGLLYYLNSRRPVPQVTLAPLTRGNLNSWITSNGKVEPVNPYALRAKFDGFVTAVPAVEGSAVRPGELLVTLDDSELRAQLDQERAQLASEQDDLRAAEAGGRANQLARVTGDLRVAEAQRDLLQRQQESLTKLAAQKAATPQEVEKNQEDLVRATADVEQLRKTKEEFDHQVQADRDRLALLVAHSQADVKNLEAKLDAARVLAPVKGTLYSLPVHARDFVHTGDLLAEVADLSQVRVRAFIDEPELGRLQPQQVVEVTWDAMPERTWMGRTEALPQQVVARGARNVGEVLCAISNDKMSLIPNTTVDVRIQLAERSSVLLVPRGAVQTEGLHRYVFLVDGGRLHRKEIKVGASDDAEFEVVSGLAESDAVALPGDVPLKDNAQVRVTTPE
jgi:HlyD family secretion protein